MRLFPLLLFSSLTLLAGSDQCVPPNEARTALRSYDEQSQNLTFAEQRKAIDELAAKYPDVWEIQTKRIAFYRWNLRSEWPSVRQAYAAKAEQPGAGALAATLAAAALHRSDTPRAIALLTKTRETSPEFPWAALKLAEIYQGGKFEDKAKAKANFDAYVAVCGEHLSRSADWIMTKVADNAAQAAIARKFRSRLESEEKPEPADYERLWGMEFRSRPPAQHPELRKQVAKDVARLLASKPDKRQTGSLYAGMKQSGASKEERAAFEERVLKEAPASDTAYTITYERWKSDHKEPVDHKDTAAWEAWKKVSRSATKEWAARFTEVTWLENSYVSAMIDDRQMSEKDAIPAIEKRLEIEVARNGPYVWTYVTAARRLLKEGWAPARAHEWMEKAWALAADEDRAILEDDTLTDERRKENLESTGYRGSIATDYLRAAKLSGKTTVPESVRAFVEGPMPVKKADHSVRYRSLAWLAALDGHEADSLAYFQQALFTRDKTPQYFRGKVEDLLLEEAKSAYLKTGGTEKAFALWSKPVGRAQELAEGRWEKPKKALEPFELADVSGKTWKLKQLEGKAVLINLWATWCGPCRNELPHFQKLYEKTKDRADIQVISFNVDEDLGLVEPYMKEQGYTFPALAAFPLIRGMFDGWAIPQNWLVDPKGNWIATQVGFDASDTDWENSMLKRLETAKQGKPPAGVE